MRVIALLDVWLAVVTCAMIVFCTLHFLRYLYLLGPHVLGPVQMLAEGAFSAGDI
jgi:hypothetical protein